MSKHGRSKYFNKIPPFKPDPEHYTRKQHSWKAKVAYETEEEAWEFLQQNPKMMAQGVPEMARGAQGKLKDEEQFKTKNKRCNKHTIFI